MQVNKRATSTLIVIPSLKKIDPVVANEVYKVKDGGPDISVSAVESGLYKVPTTAGRTKSMPHGEEHRKAVCGKTACTV
jgi:hypothetical protein